MQTAFDCGNGLLKTAPKVLILTNFAHDPQTFENVDDIVYPSPLDVKLEGDLVQLKDVPLPALESHYELPAEFLKGF